MKTAYKKHKFGDASLLVIVQCNDIIDEYAAQGFDLTLRQLYYQLVSRDLIPNTTRSYKRLGSIVTKGRLAGLIDWDAIVDRTRALRNLAHWSSPESILRSAAQSYHIDMWEHQKYRPEVWIEKDALGGVISGVCNELDTPFFACRGYVSISEMYKAARRIVDDYIMAGQEPNHETDKIMMAYIPVILHLGDHDPSGIDMTRDIIDRLELLTTGTHDEHFGVHRLALNWDQVQQYGPPPNPTKLSDSRAKGYVAKYGYDSWELDALEPSVIVGLIRDAIEKMIDKEQWKKDEARKRQVKKELGALHQRYGDVIEFLEKP